MDVFTGTMSKNRNVRFAKSCRDATYGMLAATMNGSGNPAVGAVCQPVRQIDANITDAKSPCRATDVRPNPAGQDVCQAESRWTDSQRLDRATDVSKILKHLDERTQVRDVPAAMVASAAAAVAYNIHFAVAA